MEITLNNDFMLNELEFDELHLVNGGIDIGDIAVGIAGAAVGMAVGFAVGGPVGAAIGGKNGAAIGSVVGTVIGAGAGWVTEQVIKGVANG